jgi:GTP cyclohydrolase I
VNAKALEEAVRAFLEALGEPVLSEDIARTPERVAEAWANELLSGYAQDPASLLTWEPVSGEQGLVVVQDIDFQSVCVHHLLPFTGKASIAYLPEGRQAGLSKLARLVDCLSRRLQLQERLTAQILQAVSVSLRPRGAACLIEAEHQCMSCRGVRRPNARVITVLAHGACAAEPVRAETMRLLAPAKR